MLFAGLTYVISQFHSLCCPSVTTACPLILRSALWMQRCLIFLTRTQTHTHTSSGPFIRLDSERGPEPWGLTLNLTVTLQILSWRRRVLHLLLSFKTLNSLSPWNVRPIKKSQGFEFFFCLDRDLLCTTRKSCRDEIKRKSLILFLSVPLQMFPLKRNCKYFLCGLFCWYTTSQAFLMLSELVPTTIHTLWHTHTDTHARSDHLAAIAQSGNTHVRISHSVCVCFSQKTHNRVYLCENACGGKFWLPSESTVCVWSRTSVCCALVLYSWEKLSPPRVCDVRQHQHTYTHLRRRLRESW